MQSDKHTKRKVGSAAYTAYTGIRKACNGQRQCNVRDLRRRRSFHRMQRLGLDRRVFAADGAPGASSPRPLVISGEVAGIVAGVPDEAGEE